MSRLELPTNAGMMVIESADCDGCMLSVEDVSNRYPAKPPPADNDNWHLLPDWMTPAELLQWVRKDKERMRQELAADFRLRSCPKHRQDWDVLVAIERCTLWHCYGMR